MVLGPSERLSGASVMTNVNPRYTQQPRDIHVSNAFCMLPNVSSPPLNGYLLCNLNALPRPQYNFALFRPSP
jgi:hypothetical protein